MRTHKSIASNEYGFTLVELLISLTIMVFIGAVIFQLFYVSSNNWQQAKARTESAQHASRAMKLIGDDIRSSQKSSLSTSAVVVDPSGDIIDVYRYNVASSRYEQIRYRYNSSDRTLQRAMVYSSTPINITNWNSASWSTIASNVSKSTDGAGAEYDVFQDTSGGTSEDGRRRIAVNLRMNGSAGQGSDSACKVNDVYCTRSQVVEGQAIGADSTIKVTGISVSPTSITKIAKTGATVPVTATIYPSNATNKTISAASSDTWLHCSVSGLTINITVDSHTGSGRSGSITVTSEDEDHWSTVINCSQK
ncbi:MAG: prepilin-type N-terminal cleavage/methylation domain-containing protein [Deltaproteobacteria bacterium]